MDIFVARQPIFNRKKEVFAYELLFRDSLENYYRGGDEDRATSGVLSHSFLTIGIEELTRGKTAFINFSARLLQEEVPTLFSPDILAVEVLETIKPEQGIIECCRKLKKQGYYLVLDDFVFKEEFRPLLELADLIKVDFLRGTPRERELLYGQLEGYPDLELLAEKVETEAQFKEALQAGYSYFQGYFFCEPIIVSAADVPGFKFSYLNLIKEANKKNADFAKLAEIIKKDLTLSYKVLKLINSSAFGFRERIESIQQALVLLGLNECQRWVTLLAMSGLLEEKPRELMITSLVRARFAEHLAFLMNLQDRSQELFLMGMLSLIDSFLGRPLPVILTQLPLSESIRQALLKRKGDLSTVLELLQQYEDGNWKEVERLAREQNLDPAEISRCYYKAITWTNSFQELW